MTESWDLAVIGAGIHGAGVAQAAAARGLRVVVLEQRAVAHGTSSRSSKLIHGGLRYLETAQLDLVRECLRERARLLRLAPDLVRLVPFHIPVYRDTRRRPWQIGLGLALYALLAGLGPHARFTRLPRHRWDRLDGLRTGGLQAVFRYHDGQTDDAALTRAVLRSALDLGAELRLPARVTGGRLTAQGVVLRYRAPEGAGELTARAAVNAAGPWVNRVRAAIRPAPPGLPVELVQGSHLLLDARLAQGAYYLEAPRDGRAVFALPWHEGVMLGTTETPYAGDPEGVRPLPEEEDYLRETAAHYLPHLGDAPRTGAFAGLRVLPAGQDPAFRRPRRTLLVTDRRDRPRWLTVYGGKLTAYRAEADKILHRLAPSLPRRRPVADTRRLPLAPD